MKTPRPLSVASRHSLVHRLRLSYERGLVASVVTAVSRSYTTLALGILLLGYLSTELLPHRALSLGLALCGGGAFLYGALVSFAEGTRLSHYVAQVGRTRALRLGLMLLLILAARLYYAHSVEAITEVRLPLHTPLRAVLTEEEEVQDATLRLRIRLLAEGNIPTALLQLTCTHPDSTSIRVGDTLTLSLERLSYVRELPSEREGYARYLTSEGVTAMAVPISLPTSRHPAVRSFSTPLHAMPTGSEMDLLRISERAHSAPMPSISSSRWHSVRSVTMHSAGRSVRASCGAV